MPRSAAIPFAVACLGILTFTLMDTVMKRLSIEMGAYAAILWRQGMAAVLAGSVFFAQRHPWPEWGAMRFHLTRGLVGALMATSWFYGLARLPMAEAVALSFIAPLIALYLASLLLGEKVPPASIAASLLGVAGVGIMLAARLYAPGERHLDGVAAIFVSAVLYAWNLVLMRQQALVAKAIEVAFFQNLISGGWLLIVLPVILLVRPDLAVIPTSAQWPLLLAGALLTVVSLFLLSWSFARAEATVLIPVEYTGFVWLAIWGAIFYAEAVTWTTLAGVILIAGGSIIAARAAHVRGLERPAEIGA